MKRWMSAISPLAAPLMASFYQNHSTSSRMDGEHQCTAIFRSSGFRSRLWLHQSCQRFPESSSSVFPPECVLGFCLVETHALFSSHKLKKYYDLHPWTSNLQLIYHCMSCPDNFYCLFIRLNNVSPSRSQKQVFSDFTVILSYIMRKGCCGS